MTWLGWTPVKRKSCLFLSVWGEGTQGLACRGAECGWAGGQGSMWALIYEESALPKSEFVKMVFGVRILFFFKVHLKNSYLQKDNIWIMLMHNALYIETIHAVL